MRKGDDDDDDYIPRSGLGVEGAMCLSQQYYIAA
jgi:hypothetical protein